ncbi:AI-2E family transporter [Sediminibacterium ginsengisoli]|uniref:Predicted PurR-regulated permease PerM n=1 Tax=Sediminibacterium ginsengisoli TaxID=413434 RepID=A0A1T4MC51_9BACT|nr:AI-2E family transporter [Sediminibacterium ginsengisoli]SJZ64456.1 Predicted PurR-regulated permease PerM [Sediminibacterium ginsengisoli]
MPLSRLSRSIDLPLYSKLSQVILGLIGFFYIIYIGRDVLTPVVFSLVFAILLNPAINFLCGRGLNRPLAILIVLAVSFLAVLGLLYFIGIQLSMFADTFPQFKKNFESMFNDILNWVSRTFNVARPQIDQWVNNVKKDSMGNGTAVIGQTLGSITGVLAMLFLMPVYMFTILFYKPLLLQFVASLFDKRQHTVVAEVLQETKVLIQSYLAGLLIEMVIVAVMNAGGLLIIGVKYAILLGILGALLNLIPYIGGIIAIALPVIIALATGNPNQVIWVVALYLFNQFIDNNIVVPRIVASKVKINAFISILVVFIGGALWGISGMFLSIPITAIAKVIFDRIDGLQPFGLLLGDNQPDLGKQIFRFKKPARKKEDNA